MERLPFIPMQDEQAKPIRGFTNYLITSRGRVWSQKTQHFLRTRLNHNQRLTVSLSGQGKTYTRFVTNLVWDAFATQPRNRRTQQVCCTEDTEVDLRIENLYLFDK